MDFIKQHVQCKYKGNIMRGMLHRPTTSGNSNVPIVVMLHGFTGSRVETHRMFFHISEELERVNVASLRFDFIGCGESDGDYQCMTVTSLIHQGRQILNWLFERLEYPGEVILLGYSLGGIVASELVKEYGNIFKTILISPSRPRFTQQQLNELFSDPAVKMMNLSGYQVGRGYYDDLEHYFVDTPFPSEQKVLVIHGSEDQINPPKIGYEYLSIPGGRKRFALISKADHAYLTPDVQQELIHHIIQFVMD